MSDEGVEFNQPRAKSKRGRTGPQIIVMSNDGASREAEVPVAVAARASTQLVVPPPTTMIRIPKPSEGRDMEMTTILVETKDSVTGQPQSQSVPILSSELAEWNYRQACIAEDKYSELFTSTAELIFQAQTLRDALRSRARCMIHLMTVNDDLTPEHAETIVRMALENHYNFDNAIERSNTFTLRVKAGQQLAPAELMQSEQMKCRCRTISTLVSRGIGTFKEVFNEELDDYDNAIIPATIEMQRGDDGYFEEGEEETATNATASAEPPRLGSASTSVDAQPPSAGPMSKILPLHPHDKEDPRNRPRGARTGVLPYDLTPAQQRNVDERKRKRKRRPAGSKDAGAYDAPQQAPMSEEELRDFAEWEKRRDAKLAKEKLRRLTQEVKRKAKRAEDKALLDEAARIAAEELLEEHEEAQRKAAFLQAPVTSPPTTNPRRPPKHVTVVPSPDPVEPPGVRATPLPEETPPPSRSHSSMTNSQIAGAKAVPDEVREKLSGLMRETAIPVDCDEWVLEKAPAKGREGTYTVYIRYNPPEDEAPAEEHAMEVSVPEAPPPPESPVEPPGVQDPAPSSPTAAEEGLVDSDEETATVADD
jgi:hypothetical protein